MDRPNPAVEADPPELLAALSYLPAVSSLPPVRNAHWVTARFGHR